MALLLTSPVNGDFWWSDAPRHALNGVFLKDFVAAHPAHPVAWAIDYYLRRPALTIMFYPPFFYLIEAVFFAVFGVSHATAQATVICFVALLGISSYQLARIFLPRGSALGASLLVIGAPGAAFWGRQVMLDLPAYALIVTAALFLARTLRSGRPASLYLAVLFTLAAVYTKYNAAFAIPALVLAFIIARGREALRDRHAWGAALLGFLGLIPAVAILLAFGRQNFESVSGLAGAIPIASTRSWVFYIKAVPAQLGIAAAVLSVGGLVVILRRLAGRADRWAYAMLIAWLAVGYVTFSSLALKEPRDTLAVLFPLAIAAPLFLVSILPKGAGEIAGLVLGAGTLIYSLVFVPVPKVGGYQQIADYLAANAPRNSVLVYSGYRDGNLIFDLSTHPQRNDIAVVRIDKLLLSIPLGERRRGVKQSDAGKAQISQLLRRVGADYLIIQPGFWSDLQEMDRFDAVAHSQDFRKTRHFDLWGNLSTSDGSRGIDIYRPTYPVSRATNHIGMNMPLLHHPFEGSLAK